MPPAKNHNLEEAKTLFYSWKMLEAYHVLRRFFDRLPFCPEPEHAEYISIFARVLAELGKTQELSFYRRELEKTHKPDAPPYLSYALAFCHAYANPPQWERARELFEKILGKDEAKLWHCKAKMMLADYYDTVRGDTTAASHLIESIEIPRDAAMRRLVWVWRAKCLRDTGNFEQAKVQYEAVISEAIRESDWYGHFSAAVGLAILHCRRGEKKQARDLARILREIVSGRNLKSAESQLNALEGELLQASHEWRLNIKRKGGSLTVSCGTHQLCLGDSATDRVLLELMKKRFLDKPHIVKAMCGRPYERSTDDSLVYHQIHSARKLLKGLGLPSKAIVAEQRGYRFVPEVHWAGGNK